MSCDKIAETNVIYQPDQLIAKTPDRNIGAVVQLNCLDGYKLDGAKSLTCQSNGQWSGPVPKCVKAVSSSLSKEETIVIAVVSAVVAAVLLGLLVLCICYQLKKKKQHRKEVLRYPDSRHGYNYSQGMDRGSIHSSHSVPGMAWYTGYGSPSSNPDYYSMDRAHLTRGQVKYPTYDQYGGYGVYDDGYNDGYGREQVSSFHIPRASYNSDSLQYYGGYGRY